MSTVETSIAAERAAAGKLPRSGSTAGRSRSSSVNAILPYRESLARQERQRPPAR